MFYEKCHYFSSYYKLNDYIAKWLSLNENFIVNK